MKESWKTINEILNKDPNRATLIALRILGMQLLIKKTFRTQ